MSDRLRTLLEVLSFIVVVSLIWVAIPAQAHSLDCAGKTGVEAARCARHQKMAALCEAKTGDAHFACDRAFLLANPLPCEALQGDDAKQCQAEGAAFKVCEPKAGRDFMQCVRDKTGASPMGS
jgi:hypothetical protein